MSDTASTRFMLQMFANIFICKYSQQYISKEILKNNRPSTKSYLLFIAFSILLFSINQGLFFLFKDPNLYQKIGIPRKYSLHEVQQFGKNNKIQIMGMNHIEMQVRVQKVKESDEIISVLSHPARRLSYDSFGHAQVDYAWAFKSQSFILSTIISSSIFYVICTVMNMMSSKKGEVKSAFKAQIMVMILLFLWEIQLIISTEEKLHNFPSDLIDSIYTAFPIFERREMLKIVVIPCMSLVDFFLKFYMQTELEKKILSIMNNQHLRKLTARIGMHMLQIKVDEDLEDKLNKNLSEMMMKEPLNAEIYNLQREVVRCLLILHGEELIPKQNIVKGMKYLKLK